MLITGVISYQVNESDVAFLTKKIKEYCEGFLSQSLHGELADMEISERRIEFEYDASSVTVTVDTYGVDLEDEEQETVILAISEGFTPIIDSPFIDDNREVWLKDAESSFNVSESQD